MSKTLTKVLILLVSYTSVLTSAFATSYTWNGVTSTAWGTSTNWTPNGVPGSGDNVTIVTTSNQPTYNGVAGVTNITMTSGTLNLNTYTLTASGTAAFSGGTINNGTMNLTGTSCTFAGTVMNAKVIASCGSIYLNGSKFNNNATLTKTGGTANYGSGGNVFNDTLILTNSGSAYLASAVTTNPDTFNYAVYLTCNSSYLAIGSGTTGNLFAADLYLSNASTNGIYMNYTGSAKYNGNIYVSNSVAGPINFGQSGGTATLASGKTIIEGAAGFNNGSLGLRYFTKNGSIPVDLNIHSSAYITIGPSSTIYGDFTFSGGNFYLNGGTFNDDVSFTKTGTTDVYSTGGNVFNDDAAFINTSANHFYFCNTTGDDFNGNLTTTQSSTGPDIPRL